MRKCNRILNIIMITAVCITVVGIIADYVYLNILHPDLYATQSAPWYTAGLLYCTVTFVILLICFAVKTVIRHKENI